jgi:hypothetical protein
MVRKVKENDTIPTIAKLPWDVRFTMLGIWRDGILA